MKLIFITIVIIIVIMIVSVIVNIIVIIIIISVIVITASTIGKTDFFEPYPLLEDSVRLVLN
jgi:hypothetical protein